MDGAELLEIAERAARAAAAVLLDHEGRRAAESISTKSSPTDLVSAADVAAEQAIRELLARERPRDAILGEEGDDKPGDSGLSWIVDPLDGTVNYLFGIPQWCVSIACEGPASAGVILDPPRGECFRVSSEGTATLDGDALAASTCSDLSTALVATGFGYDAAVREVQARTGRRAAAAGARHPPARQRRPRSGVDRGRALRRLLRARRPALGCRRRADALRERRARDPPARCARRAARGRARRRRRALPTIWRRSSAEGAAQAR